MSKWNWVIKAALGFLTVIVFISAVSLLMNHRATAAAEAFCASTPAGSSLGAAIEAAHSLQIEIVQDAENQHRFLFPGWYRNKAECVVASHRGVVIATIGNEAASL
ncbi:hypothetical protein HC024_02985 [Methylococcaceae bacterium WWC4]|nr:hypothetical protein [Methylococcaceae bacterium WWC4]